MTFSPIDKLPPLAPPAALEPARENRPVGDIPSNSAQLDPHAVLALDAWPAGGGPRLFDSLEGTASFAGQKPQGADDLDRIAAHVVSFLT